jgi:hypothetical protein
MPQSNVKTEHEWSEGRVDTSNWGINLTTVIIKVFFYLVNDLLIYLKRLNCFSHCAKLRNFLSKILIFKHSIMIISIKVNIMFKRIKS